MSARVKSKRKDPPPPEKPKTKERRKPNSGQFQKGDRAAVGNAGPVMKLAKRFLTAAIIDRLTKLERVRRGGEKGKVIAAMHKLADVLVHKAVNEEDLPAIREVLDRVEGKAIQAVELSGRGGGAIEMITGEMSPEDAARAYASTLAEGDPDTGDVETTRRRGRR